MLNIGLIAVMNHWYAGAVTSGADRVAADRGYDFVVMNSAGRSDEDLLIDRARRLGTRVDGALIIDVNPDSGLLDRLIEAVAVPVVTLGCKTDDVSAVLVDNPAIGAMSACHLYDLGHRSAAVLTLAPPSPSAMNNGLIRARGFTEAFGGPSATTVTALSRDERDERQRQILQATSGVSAVFCTSDALAIETVALLRQAGRDIPGDVAVIGVDDHPLAQPIGLTTVQQSPESMGEAATELLLERMLTVTPTKTVYAETRLVERQTTGPPQGRSPVS